MTTCSNHPERAALAKALCASCYQIAYRASSSAVRQAHLEAKARYQRRAVLRKYGYTEASYAEAVEAREGRCDICGEVPVYDGRGKNPKYVTPRTLDVDHDHSTGRTRGLLCSRCNSRVLPVVENSPALIERAVAYLEQWSADGEGQ